MFRPATIALFSRRHLRKSPRCSYLWEGVAPYERGAPVKVSSAAPKVWPALEMDFETTRESERKIERKKERAREKNRKKERESEREKEKEIERGRLVDRV